jgi:hypothetical protein
MDPPENALVLSVDEKPHIQARERAQGFLQRSPTSKRATSKAVNGFLCLNRNLAKFNAKAAP